MTRGMPGVDAQVDRRQLASGDRALGMHCQSNGSANYESEYQWRLVWPSCICSLPFWGL